MIFQTITPDVIVFGALRATNCDYLFVILFKLELLFQQFYYSCIFHFYIFRFQFKDLLNYKIIMDLNGAEIDTANFRIDFCKAKIGIQI